jgi:hypothetical protein
MDPTTTYSAAATNTMVPAGWSGEVTGLRTPRAASRARSTKSDAAVEPKKIQSAKTT